LVTNLYYGSSKNLNFLTFMKPLVEEMADLIDGFEIIIDDVTETFVPLVSYCSVDLPAKSKVQGIRYCVGKDSCGSCYHPGVSMKTR
jgi:hypothetical protein